MAGPTAFQPNAFQNNAFQIAPPVAPPSILDQGGFWQSVLIDRGPTLGFEMVRVMPPLRVSSNTTLGPDAQMVLCISGGLTLTLPSVALWMTTNKDQVRNAFGGGIVIKDLSGGAQGSPHIINPFGSDTIDGFSTYSIGVNRGVLRLYPLNDLSGWFVG